MKAWKTILVAFMTFMLVMPVMAQEPNEEYTRKGDKIMLTRYYEDGSVKEQGTYADGTPDGRWVQYNQDGTIKIEAFYQAGQKTGKWFVWSDGGEVLYELVYNDNKLQNSSRYKLEERNHIADK